MFEIQSITSIRNQLCLKNRMYDGYILQSFKKHEAFVFRNNQDSLHIADWFYIEFIT